MSNTRNPFSDSPANPYQSPTFEAFGAGPVVPFTHYEARLRLVGPAIGLAISALCWLGYMAFVSFITIIDMSRIAAADARDPATDFAGQVGMIVGALLGTLIFSLPGLVMLAGSVQMLRVRGYRWCWAGAIAGVVPCTVCIPLSLPFGIWGIIALCNSRMRPAFSGGHKSVSRRTDVKYLKYLKLKSQIRDLRFEISEVKTRSPGLDLK